MGRNKDANRADLACYVGAWTVPVPVLVLDHPYIVFANQAMLDLLGFDDAWSAIGLKISDVLHPDMHPTEVDRREIMTRTGRGLTAVPTKFIRADGGAVHAEVTVNLVDVLGAQLSVGIITPRNGVRSGGRLGEPPALGSVSGELGRAVLESIDTPIIIQDPESVLFANRASVTNIHAEDRSQVEGHSYSSLSHGDAEDAAAERARIVLSATRPLLNIPVKLKRLDGTPLHATSDLYPLRMRDEKLVLVVSHPLD